MEFIRAAKAFIAGKNNLQKYFNSSVDLDALDNFAQAIVAASKHEAKKEAPQPKQLVIPMSTDETRVTPLTSDDSHVTPMTVETSFMDSIPDTGASCQPEEESLDGKNWKWTAIHGKVVSQVIDSLADMPNSFTTQKLVDTLALHGKDIPAKSVQGCLAYLHDLKIITRENDASPWKRDKERLKRALRDIAAASV